MRIVLFLLTATAAAASGTALAQSGTLSPASGGGPTVATGSWSPGHAVGRHRDFRRGRHDRRRHGERFDLRFGGISSVEEFEAVDPHGNGFFAGGGGQVRVQGGRPYYEYDRNYPYEWASAAAGSARWVLESAVDIPARCTAEHGVRVCRGR